jgi:V-type H+-transporting ATPase subunit a
MYTGLIYNDIFSKSLNLFGSHWHTNYNESTVMHNKDLQINPSLSADYDQVPYPVGLDPIWQVKMQLYNKWIIFFVIYLFNITL